MIRKYLLLFLAPCAPLLAKADVEQKANIAVEQRSDVIERKTKHDRSKGLAQFTRRAFGSVARAFDAVWQSHRAPEVAESVLCDWDFATSDEQASPETTCYDVRRSWLQEAATLLSDENATSVQYFLATQRLLI